MRAIFQLVSRLDEQSAELLSIISQSTIVFTFSLGCLVSGLLAANLFSKIQSSLILMLFPAILTLRGDVNGILSSKFSTFLHTGRIKPFFFGNAKDYKILIQTIFSFTILDMYLLGIFAFIINYAIGSVDIRLFPLFIIIPVLTGGISAVVSEITTSILAIYTFRGGLDPDILLYPMMSTINDISIVAIYSIVSWIVFSLSYSLQLPYFIFILITIITIFFMLMNSNEEIFLSIFLEATPIILLCLFFGILSGTILAGFQFQLQKFPAILIIYPVLMSAMGNIGAISGKITTTKLFLGEWLPKFSSIEKFFRVFLFIEASALMLHIIYSIVGSVLSSNVGYPIPFHKFALIVFSSNLVIFPFISLISYIIAVKTFQRGWDPDNFVVPLETSIADFLAVLTVSSFAVVILI